MGSDVGLGFLVGVKCRVLESHLFWKVLSAEIFFLEDPVKFVFLLASFLLGNSFDFSFFFMKLLDFGNL